MWALIDILKYSFSSVIWGILIAVACMALFVFLIKGWYKDATFSPFSYLIGVVLFVFLAFQCILIVVSLKILATNDDFETDLISLVNSSYDSTAEVARTQADELRSYMRWYIFRRILWCLGFVIVGSICVIKTLTRSYKSTRQSERLQRQRVQIDRPRVNRRPRK